MSRSMFTREDRSLSRRTSDEGIDFLCNKSLKSFPVIFRRLFATSPWHVTSNLIRLSPPARECQAWPAEARNISPPPPLQANSRRNTGRNAAGQTADGWIAEQSLKGGSSILPPTVTL